MKMVRTLMLAGAVSFGCVTVNPERELMATEKSVSLAEQEGVAKSTKAAEHLQLAKSELKEARSLIAQGLNERARDMLLRAHADAELSRALAQEEHDRAEAKQLMDQVQAMRAQ